jgi:putative spermidine/putrescine transport system permease protein
MILARLLYRAWVAAGFVFLPLPIVVVVISSFSRSGYLQFPPQALSLRWYAAFLSDAGWLRALGVSIVLAVLAAALVTLLALLAALARTRLRWRGAAAFDLLMLSPLLLPHAAIGLSLLTVLSALGWIGAYPGLLLAHAILCAPFAYRPLINALRRLDLSMEEAAMNLGAPPMLVFRKVTLPLLRSGIVAAFLFSFIISFDEVSVTLFLVGPNVTTLPVRVFTEIQESGSPVVAAISSFLVVATVLMFLAADRLVGLRLFVTAEVAMDRDAR